MLRLKTIYRFLFLVGLFFIPFNQFEGIAALGEYKNEAATYFFLLGFVVLAIETGLKRSLSLPVQSTLVQLLLIFISWCFLTFIFNYPIISASYYKQTTGVNRFIRQYSSLLISTVIFTILFWNSIRTWSLKMILIVIRRIFFCSLLFVFTYGFIETLIAVYGFYNLLPVLKLFDYFPFVNTTIEVGARISSISYEVPALGNYLITISGWMFSYMLTSKNVFQRYLPTFFVFFLMYFSGSRTALIIVTIQFVVFILILLNEGTYRKKMLLTFKLLIPVFFVLFLVKGTTITNAFLDKIETINFSKNLKHNISNQTRFGMQYASLQVFKEHPVTGVGFGQETYHKIKHYPYWAKRNNYEFPEWYENQSLKSFPPAYNLYTRLLAEVGFIGFCLFFFLVFLTLYGANYYLKRTSGLEKALASVLLVSFVGLSLNWLQMDFFRQYGFWLCLCILILMQQKALSQQIKDK